MKKEAKIKTFNELLRSGFDVSFNFNDVFYTISTGELDGVDYYFLGDENCVEKSKFSTIEEVNNYKIGGLKSIKEIVIELKEDEIYY